MTTAPSSLQDLPRRLYTKAEAEPSWRFWGLYVHACKRETLYEAYRRAQANNGAPGSDGVTFAAIEASGVEAFLQQLRDELVARTYPPLRLRHQAIPKDGGTKVRVLSRPTIRDRVVQGALTLILEPSFEADFQPGSDGYRPQRRAQDAVLRVADAIVKDKPRGIDVDLQADFDNVRHHRRVATVAPRVSDPDILQGRKLILKASGTPGGPQGGVMSPWRSKLYLTAVDRRLERAKEVTRRGPSTDLEYARFAEDLVSLVDASPQPDWRLKAVGKRLREELAVVHVTLKEAKSRIGDLATGERGGFLGFEFRRVRSRTGKGRASYPPLLTKRTARLRTLKDIVRGHQAQPIERVISLSTPLVRGWVRSVAVGDASRCFGFMKAWGAKKGRRHLMRARKLRGFGWKRWRRRWRYEELGLFNGDRVQRPRRKALPA